MNEKKLLRQAAAERAQPIGVAFSISIHGREFVKKNHNSCLRQNRSGANITER